ncbi:pyridoxal phosphate-dependent transferase [Melanogaster broomeanus]|nr:pyridoxal phosphate-dependent transferase [Melanogaster broomeanus]
MLAINAVRRAPAVLRSAAPLSTWSAVPAGPPDPILGITEAFKADKDSRKINLGVGAYRDENGKPYVLNAVKKAEEKMASAKLDKEYLPITGLANFTQHAAKLAYGAESAPLTQKAIAVTQSISGTGALRIGGAFMARHYPGAKIIYLPNPTWGNHIPLFKDSGLEVRQYRYFDKKTVGLDFAGLKEDSRFASDSQIQIPAPPHSQWKELSDLIAEKKLFPFFDMAYQALLLDRRHVALCQSFAKNMGLYGERRGREKRVDSQLKIIVRPMYSNPPLHGAHIASTILSDPELYKEWEGEVKGMADRIINMRESFTGLNTEQCKALAEKAHIYMTMDGRISMAGLNGGNVEYFAQAPQDGFEYKGRERATC